MDCRVFASARALRLGRPPPLRRRLSAARLHVGPQERPLALPAGGSFRRRPCRCSSEAPASGRGPADPSDSAQQAGTGSNPSPPPAAAPSASPSPPSPAPRRPSPSAARPPSSPAASTDWVASAVTRRFGLAGGLAWVGFLAFGVVSEQIKTRREVFLEEQNTRDVALQQEVLLPSGVRFTDLRVGGGAQPLPGDLLLLSLRGAVLRADQLPAEGPPLSSRSLLEEAGAAVFTGPSRDIAWLFGARPLPPGVVPGLLPALASMRAGGRRRVVVPSSAAMGGAAEGAEEGAGALALPPGALLAYEVELKRVSVPPS